MLKEAIILSIIMFVTFGGNWLFGQCMLDRPIVVSALVGLALGDLKTGVIIGASLEAAFLGAINVGGAISANPAVGAVFGTGFAIILGGGTKVALALGIPIGILGALVEILGNSVNSFFASKFDRLAAEGDEKGIIKLHFGLWALTKGLFFSIIVFFSVLYGSKAIASFVDSIPKVVMSGLSITAGLLPAIGFAMLLRMLWDKKIGIFYILGFVLVAYLKLPLIALAVIAMVIAVYGAIREKEIYSLVTANGQVTKQDDEEDFFDE